MLYYNFDEKRFSECDSYRVVRLPFADVNPGFLRSSEQDAFSSLRSRPGRIQSLVGRRPEGVSRNKPKVITRIPIAITAILNEPLFIQKAAWSYHGAIRDTSLIKVRLFVQMGVKVGTAGMIIFEVAVGCSGIGVSDGKRVGTCSEEGPPTQAVKNKPAKTMQEKQKQMDLKGG